MDRASAAISEELTSHQSLFQRAILRNWCDETTTDQQDQQDENDHMQHEQQQEEDHDCPRVALQALKKYSPVEASEKTECAVCRWYLTNLNNVCVLYPNIANLSMEDRHDALYSSDQIIP